MQGLLAADFVTRIWQALRNILADFAFGPFSVMRVLVNALLGRIDRQEGKEAI